MPDPTQADFAAILRGLDLLLQAASTTNESLAALHQKIDDLAPKPGEPNPLHDLLERIAGSLDRMEGKIDDLLAARSKPNGVGYG